MKTRIVQNEPNDPVQESLLSRESPEHGDVRQSARFLLTGFELSYVAMSW